MTRKIFVPGLPAEINTIITDNERSMVFSIPHGKDVIVVFFSVVHSPSARVMSAAQAAQFTVELREAHQAIKDDAEISRLEKEFDE